ncbi:glycosyltransferase family 2 protein [Ruegeria arenilitoris]|uniref:glycosyltransferase family 2 protein n=1 Tax=Ruegeria arenilitoris TaxID=1173585 RepID=UPI00147B2F1C|nr:glycosyltransferase family A protein [Ruegeria arenilitoris]
MFEQETGKSNAGRVTVSAVVATLGRTDELTRLFETLRHQSRALDEIIVVDQNSDSRLVPVISDFGDLPIIHIQDESLRGVNRSRNHGWRHSSGDVVFFPDDDCWYPKDFIELALSKLESTDADIVSGRAASEDGQSINGKFLDQAVWVDRKTAWFTQIEWVIFLRRKVLEDTGGFDERIGPGSGTPWGANEVQDLSLTALSKHYRQYFDPDLFGHHAEMIVTGTDAQSLEKGRHYARGFGYVLAKHSYGWGSAIYWAARSVTGALVSACRGEFGMARYRLCVAQGRLNGYQKSRKTGLQNRSAQGR